MSEKDLSQVAIYIPAYNAASTLPRVLERIPARLKEKVREIFVVDNHSADNTHLVAIGYRQAESLHNLEVIRNPENLGYGGSQKLAYQRCIDRGYGCVAMLHGDAQYAPELLWDLIDPILAGKADMVFGSRMKGDPLQGGMPLHRFLGNRFLTKIQNLFMGTDLSEFHSGYRVYSVEALKKVHFGRLSSDYHFDTEIIILFKKAGLRIAELPIPTHYGDEKNYVNIWKYGIDVLVTTLTYFFHEKGWRFSKRWGAILGDSSRLAREIFEEGAVDLKAASKRGIRGFYSEARARPLFLAFFAFFAAVTVNSWFNSLLLKSGNSYTYNILDAHRRYMSGESDGCNLQRRGIPGLADGMSKIAESPWGLKVPLQLFYGRHHEIPSLLLGYEVVHFGFIFVTLLGLYLFFRRIMLLSPSVSFAGVATWSLYQTFFVTGFVTGRWTDTAVPAFFVWTILFALSDLLPLYLVGLGLFAWVREIAVVLILFHGVRFLFEKKAEFRKRSFRMAAYSAMVIFPIRGLLAVLYPGPRYCAHGDSLWAGIKMAIPWNLHDINQFKMPLLMDNILILTAFQEWRTKTHWIRALAITGVCVHLIHFITVPAGENYGRDVLAPLLLLISTWSALRWDGVLDTPQGGT